MAHAATFKSYHQLPHRAATTDEIPAKAKLHYVIIVAVLLALALGFMAVRIIAGSVDNSSNPVQRSTNAASPGSARAPGVPATSNGTPPDHTEPTP